MATKVGKAKHSRYEEGASRMVILNIRSCLSDDLSELLAIRDDLIKLGQGEAKKGLIELHKRAKNKNII